MRQTVALIFSVAAVLGCLSQQPAPVPSDSQRSEPVTPASSGSLGPAELPLVAKMLPRDRKDAPPVPVDGELSPGGQWRWSKAQWAWVPVKQAGPDWRQVGHHAATVDHLVSEHGIDRATAERLTPEQRDVAHSNTHNAEKHTGRTAPARSDVHQWPVSSSCPGGNCGNPSYSRGLFGRRR